MCSHIMIVTKHNQTYINQPVVDDYTFSRVLVVSSVNSGSDSSTEVCVTSNFIVERFTPMFLACRFLLCVSSTGALSHILDIVFKESSL